ncbi:DNA helicase [Microbacterium marinilacus]|uniref:DNA helicase n=1 Tax=Microbacterium marinilacus TaxID=415209 RepID=A0ABP7BKV2_9MICO|nr:DNA helicase [Microbacterium marinilacus]MBY0688404.1 DNA helicase [Microbacterium marinilacus]
MSLTKKRKKELRKLQDSAAHLWEAQQVLVSDAADVAREAGRQLGNFNRERVAPVIDDKYHHYVEPVVDRVAPYVDSSRKASKQFLDSKVVPTVGSAVGKALSAWDAANDTRIRIAKQRAGIPFVEPKKKRSAGPIIAIVLGVAAAGAVLYAAWQTLRADDELWVADDPLASPDA